MDVSHQSIPVKDVWNLPLRPHQYILAQYKDYHDQSRFLFVSHFKVEVMIYLSPYNRSFSQYDDLHIHCHIDWLCNICHGCYFGLEASVRHLYCIAFLRIYFKLSIYVGCRAFAVCQIQYCCSNQFFRCY